MAIKSFVIIFLRFLSGDIKTIKDLGSEHLIFMAGAEEVAKRFASDILSKKVCF